MKQISKNTKTIQDTLLPWQHRGWLAALTVLSLAACGGDTTPTTQTAPKAFLSSSGGSASMSGGGAQQINPQGQTLAQLNPASLAAMLTQDSAALQAQARFEGLLPVNVDSQLYPNEHGMSLNYSVNGKMDLDNPFFKPFGNGRSCVSCHAPADGFSITPASLKRRFWMSSGTDPIFMKNDGTNSPNAPRDTLTQRYNASSMLLNKGLIRVGLKIPAQAEFELVRAEDPYGYASAQELSLFRRPLPSANLKFNSNIMWDGRETGIDPNNKDNCIFPGFCLASLDSNLARQADGATRGHAEFAAGLTAAQQKAVVDFEKSLVSVQIFDFRSGFLSAAGAKGGPRELLKTVYYPGINDQFFGNVRTGAPFDPNVMQMFGSWERNNPKRQAIARGEKLFNTRLFEIRNVGGINDDLRIPVVKNGACVTCHNVPQAGSNSFPFPENIGVADAARRTPDMPLYTLRNKQTGEVLQTTDPGQAMITGLWKDIGRFKTPNLRGLASRAPYFHDGSAATIRDTMVFYNTRFDMRLTPQEMDDMTAFLAAL